MSQFKYLTYEESDRRAIISINRPEVYNALNIEAKMEVIAAIREANKSKNVASIILTGNGKAFCTGQDLNDRSVQANKGTIDLGHTLETEWNPLINAIRDSKKIIIGAINGVCAGAGVSVALACDLTITHKDTKFIGAFSKIGLAPDAGSTYIFTRALGYHKTMEFFLLGEPLLGLELHQNGLINKLSENILENAKSMCDQLAVLPPLSIEMIKKNVKSSFDLSFKDSMDMEKSTQRFLGNSHDYKEGLSAFLEKRKPNFTGN
jgi:2-(1,2-epoxy-1,2-dihydrophenyl)acetyl-CoA isomerase